MATLFDRLMPRPRSIAPMGAALMMLAGAALSGLQAVFSGDGRDTVQLSVSVSVPIFLGIFGLVLLRASRRKQQRSLMWVLAPLLGTLTVAALDLATSDASAAGQVFFCFPVLFAASQLQPLGAALVTGTAIASDALVAFWLLPADSAALAVSNVSLTLVTMTALLVTAGIRYDKLIGKLESLAAVDSLTGLVTRRVLDNAAKSALSEARSGQGVALILLDLDRFKAINDSYGHPVGDQALAHAAAVLRQQLAPGLLVSRLGGDELAVLLSGCTTRDAHALAQQLVDAIHSSPLELDTGHELQLSISAGVAHAPQDAQSLSELYSVADQALYEAKRAGRGRVGVLHGSNELVAKVS